MGKYGKQNKMKLTYSISKKKMHDTKSQYGPEMYRTSSCFSRFEVGGPHRKSCV